MGKDSVLARIAMHQPVDTYLNTRATRVILQTVDPLSIDLGHFDAHRRTVSYRIHPPTSASSSQTMARSEAAPRYIDETFIFFSHGVPVNALACVLSCFERMSSGHDRKFRRTSRVRGSNLAQVDQEPTMWSSKLPPESRHSGLGLES